jgi:metal-sulfur cluster biosynthetic enzyme
MNDDELVGDVIAALRSVYDPELGIDVVALGLVYDIGVEDDRLVIEMTLTTPGCPVSESLPEQALEAATNAAAGSDRRVEVRVVWDPPWTPAYIDAASASALGLR